MAAAVTVGLRGRSRSRSRYYMAQGSRRPGSRPCCSSPCCCRCGRATWSACYSWKLILAQEGISPGSPTGSGGSRPRPGRSAAGDRRADLSTSLRRPVHRVHLHLAAVHDPAGRRPRSSACPSSLLEASADLGAGRHARSGRSSWPLGAARRRRRVDLHVLADARRLHHPHDHRGLQPVDRAGDLQLPGDGGEPAAGRRLHRRCPMVDHGDLPDRSPAGIGAFEAL